MLGATVHGVSMSRERLAMEKTTYWMRSSSIESVYETPDPPGKNSRVSEGSIPFQQAFAPAINTTVSNASNLGGIPYGPSTNTLSSSPPVSHLSSNLFVNPSLPRIRNSSWTSPFSPLGILAGVNGCASQGKSDTPGRMMKKCWPGRHRMTAFSARRAVSFVVSEESRSSVAVEEVPVGAEPWGVENRLR